MSKLSVHKKEVEKAISTFTSVKKDTKTALNELNAIYAEISECWDGKACEAYLYDLQSQISNLNANINALDELIKYAKKVKKEFEELDKAPKIIQDMYLHPYR